MKVILRVLPCLSLAAFVTLSLDLRGDNVQSQESKRKMEMTADESHEEPEDFKLTISLISGAAEKDYVIAGEPVRILASVTNVSENKSLTLIDVNPEVDLYFTVLDQKGKRVARTFYGTKLLERDMRAIKSRTSKSLLPGQSVEYTINLSRQFDLSLAGVYFVQASRKIFQKQSSGKVELKSNDLTFEIR